MDVCIVDEATQCTEPSTLLPLQMGVRSLILVGDTRQLPGTVLSRQANELGLSKSLFDRIQSSFVKPEDSPVFRLTRQYRMHPDICTWPNRFFYAGRLQTDDVTTAIADQFPLRPYTIFSLGYRQVERTLPQHHMSNSNEADFIVRMLNVLGPQVGRTNTIGIITPYAGQRDELTQRLRYVRVSAVCCLGSLSILTFNFGFVVASSCPFWR